MSKPPEGIPQDVWDIAWKLQGETTYDEVALKGGSSAELIQACEDDASAIARAIMQAEKRGEDREREACAAIIEANMLCENVVGDEVLLPRSNPGNKVGTAYATAIRQRGQS